MSFKNWRTLLSVSEDCRSRTRIWLLLMLMRRRKLIVRPIALLHTPRRKQCRRFNLLVRLQPSNTNWMQLSRLKKKFRNQTKKIVRRSCWRLVSTARCSWRSPIFICAAMKNSKAATALVKSRSNRHTMTILMKAQSHSSNNLPTSSWSQSSALCPRSRKWWRRQRLTTRACGITCLCRCSKRQAKRRAEQLIIILYCQIDTYWR